MSFYDLYGFHNVSLEQARLFFEKVLNINFEAHESLYQGGDYYRHGEKGGENFLLRKNIDPFDDNEPVEPNFLEYNILLYVNNTHRSLELQSMLHNLEQCRLLKSEEL
ncbi:hypothetical protein [Entomohabitans teleogrylli]|uniref:hypothetical protein n=1 Tax=Entomohabitans teleogrylli TaxID=1384589 RepID=UPI00073D2291|nr:hypothetical protein [Entomohabitans teleogrylli]